MRLFIVSLILTLGEEERGQEADSEDVLRGGSVRRMKTTLNMIQINMWKQSRDDEDGPAEVVVTLHDEEFVLVFKLKLKKKSVIYLTFCCSQNNLYIIPLF